MPSVTAVMIGCLAVLLAGGAAWRERLPEEVDLETGADGEDGEDEYYGGQEELEKQDATPHTEWVAVAVKDVAYFLRAHKFNDYDRRFFTTPVNVTKHLYSAFPDPPLRTLHWEVNKYCSVGFASCLRYLHEKSQQAELRRVEDTVTLVLAGEVQGEPQVEEVEGKCQQLRRLDWVGAQPFHGPLERFQWRTTASYFMCWYTMREVPQLSALGERCDNHASCLDPWLGPTNYDPRADDHDPFHCAAYSFCPDPCCPDKHYASMSACWANERTNPCHSDAPRARKDCSLKRAYNTNFVSILLGMWNTSCHCQLSGYEWSSRFGMCVDVNECISNLHTCDNQTQACFNTPGGFECICRWGFLYDHNERKCIQNNLLMAAEAGSIEKKEESFFKKILSYIVPTATQEATPHSIKSNQGHCRTRSPPAASVIIFITTCKQLTSCIHYLK